MKTSLIATLAAVAFLPLSALAQSESAGPSPSESVGCEPHGDHWHCEGPRETGATSEEDDETSSVDPGPSPTASVGCEPHGDHWHCEGPNTTLTGAASSTPAADDEDEHDHDHDHEHDREHDDEDHEHDDEDAAEAGPSPTESTGCEPHGDHWHCDGPKETSSDESSATSSDDASGDEEQEGDGDSAAAGVLAPVAGLIAAAVFAL